MFITFGVVKSAMYLWINWQKVGYSQGAKTPAEWQANKYLKPEKISLLLRFIVGQIVHILNAKISGESAVFNVIDIYIPSQKNLLLIILPMHY